VIKTGRMIITHEAPQTMGYAAEIATAVQVSILSLLNIYGLKRLYHY
jgi:pyruvate/2-oxoglutarate/acetoin dehydrogenase E1 component